MTPVVAVVSLIFLLLPCRTCPSFVRSRCRAFTGSFLELMNRFAFKGIFLLAVSSDFLSSMMILFLVTTLHLGCKTSIMLFFLDVILTDEFFLLLVCRPVLRVLEYLLSLPFKVKFESLVYPRMG